MWASPGSVILLQKNHVVGNQLASMWALWLGWLYPLVLSYIPPTTPTLTNTIAVPFGAILSSRDKFTQAYKLSILLYAVVLLILIFVPVNDTLGIIPKYEPVIVSDPPRLLPDDPPIFLSNHPLVPRERHLPSDWYRFFIDHLPVSWRSIQLLFREASHPLDWVENLLLHSAFKTLRLIIVQYFFVISEFGPLVIGACSIMLGLISFLTLPSFLSRYTSESLVCLTVFSSSVGFLFLSAAGELSL